MGGRDHSIKCETCGLQRGGLNDYKCDCDLRAGGVAMSRKLQHQARLGPWSLGELRAHLSAIVDGLAANKRSDVSPLDVALELLGGELEAFVLFGRMGHLDPPREDGKVPIAVLRRRSEDPEIDATLRETAKKWAIEQEGRS